MPQTPSIQDNKPHALLIGVNAYRNFDKNGRSDLLGSVNDVILLAYYCMAVLGIPAQNIWVLTTPKMTLANFNAKMISDELDPNQHARLLERLDQVKLGEASASEAKAGLAWLLDASKTSDGAAVFAFSGHGAWSPADGPLLCLDDTTPDFTRGVLSLKELGETIKQADVRHKLIALLDCCHVSASRASPKLLGKALPHTGTAEDVLGHDDLFNVSDRVLLGAHPGGEAFQMRLGGKCHGALTFAMVTAAERWRGERGMSHGSYKHVLKRAKLMLELLSVPQKPEIWVAIRQSPFMGVKMGPTTREPDALSSGMQLTPDFFYTINVNYRDWSDRVLAQIVATGNTDVSVNGTLLGHSTEYWYVDPAVLATLENAKDIAAITITATKILSSYSIDKTFSQTFTSLEKPTWTPGLPLPDGGSSQIFSGTPATPSNVKAYIVLNIATSGNPSLMHVQWYLPAPSSNEVFNPGDSSGIRYIQTPTTPPPAYSGAASF
jgi:Caspase domain